MNEKIKPEAKISDVEAKEAIQPTRFREHRGSITDSKETEVVINNREELVAHCKSIIGETFDFDPEKLKVEPYYDQPDSRIGWNRTYIVSIDGYGVVGFTDSPCNE